LLESLVKDFPDVAIDNLIAVLRTNEQQLPPTTQLSYDASRDLAKRCIQRDLRKFLREHNNLPQTQADNGQDGSPVLSTTDYSGFYSAVNSTSPDQPQVSALSPYNQTSLPPSNTMYNVTSASTASYGSYNPSLNSSYDSDNHSWSQGFLGIQ
jgi:hypothetical protein